MVSTAARRERLLSEFRKLDVDGSGSVEVTELAQLMSSLGISAGEDELIRMMGVVDTDHSSSLSFDEFCELFDEAQLRRVFSEIDADGDGTLTFEEVVNAVNTIGVRVPRAKIRRCFDMVDKDGNGAISFDEFSDFFQHVPLPDLRRISQFLLCNWAVDTGSELSPAAITHSNQSPLFFLVVGAVAGMISRTLTAPLEQIKIKAQVQRGGSFTQPIAIMRSIIKREGWMGLFRGNGTSLLRVAPHSALALLTYQSCVRWLPSDDEFDSMEAVWRAIAGGCAALVATTATYPLDLMRARVSVGTHRGLREAFTSTLRHGSPRALYSGLWPTLLAVGPFMIAENSVYDVSKQLMAKYRYSPGMGMYFTCGLATGVLAQALIHPLDLIRRRMQVQRTGEGVTVYKTTLHAMRTIALEEGLLGFYKGIRPAILKVAPAVAISLVIGDVVQTYASE